MNYSVIVFAAGRGSRTNLDYNKVFYTFENGQTVLNKSLSVFLSDEDCKQVITTTVLNKVFIRKLIRIKGAIILF